MIKKAFVGCLFPFLAFGKIDVFVDVHKEKNNLIFDIQAAVENPSNSIKLPSGVPVKKLTDNGKVVYFYTIKKPTKKEIILTDFYPTQKKLDLYNLTVHLPKDYKAVSEAEEIKNFGNSTFSFVFNHKREGITLILNRDWKVFTFKPRKNLSISGYFLSKPSKELLKKAYTYIKLYEEQFGKFPYKRFAVVETYSKEGFSVPTFTAIYYRLLQKPYILRLSYPHEVLHQWFGCSVYVDTDKGNWSEGLTTFFADYQFSKNKDAYRKLVLNKYEAFVDKELPLRAFKFKNSPYMEALGYGKGMYVFYMLENLLGKENFLKGIKDFFQKSKFTLASWDDIKDSLEKVSGKKLDRYFSQWVDKAYSPYIDLKVKNIPFKGNSYILTLNFSQLQPFSLRIPLVIESLNEKKTVWVELKDKKEEKTVKTGSYPLKVYLDPTYQVFRRLSDLETDPLIYYALNPKKTLKDEPSKLSEVEKKNVIFTSRSNRLLPLLVNEKTLPNFPVIKAFKNPLGEKNVLVLKEIPLPLTHLGSFSTVYLKNGRPVFERDISFFKNFSVALSAPDVISVGKGATTFKKLISDIKNSKAIYIGENHTQFSSHIAQLEIIKALYKQRKKFTIGLEMVQTPYQKYLDEFINGNLSEKEMLQKIQYFKRWGYDYKLYRPIFLFAREHKIRLVALNAPKEIIDKVSRCGLGCLSDEDWKKIPKDLDFSNLKYRQYLYQVYSRHKIPVDFVHFYESQVIWDESMAHNVARFLNANKDYSIVILAGNGHLRYRYGIPSRIERLAGIKGKVILSNDDVKPNIADYVVYFENVKHEKTKKLGVFVEKGKDGLFVKKVLKGSLAEKLGLKKTDVIIAVDNQPVKNIYDLKLGLTFLKKGSCIKVKRENKTINLCL